MNDAPSKYLHWSARRAAAFSATWLLVLLGGCALEQGHDISEANGASEETARSEKELGPVKVTVEVQPGKPRLSDEPLLTLTIRAPHGVRFEKPPFGKALGEFLIRDFHEPLIEIDGDSEIFRQIYTLEPTRSGSLTIAPITVVWRDERADSDGKSHTIESEALSIEVSTILADEAPSLANLRDPAGPVPLPAPSSNLGWWILGMLVVVAVTSAAIWKLRSRRRSVDALERSPQELARLELEKIIQQKLAATDIKAFYVELTGVVRRYIERSTGVRAPEQTTEEFLREIAGDDMFSADEQRRLREFLEAADLVKFAGYRPQKTDVDVSLDRAKRFIEHKHRVPSEVAA